MCRIRLLPLLAVVTLLFDFPLQAQRFVTILNVSDTHSHLDAIGPRDASLKGSIGGIARATTVIRQAREAEPNAILLHSGDLFQGDVFFNSALDVPELRWLKKMGFDAIALGDHELDLGAKCFADALDEAFCEGAVPFLSANATNLEAQGLASRVSHSIVMATGELPSEENFAAPGVKVGIFALTVPDELLCHAPSGMLDPEIEAIAQREVEGLISQEVEIVVLLSHLGFERDQLLAQAVGGIDLIISGHAHPTLEKPMEVLFAGKRKVYIVASSPFYANVGRTQLELNHESVRVVSYELLPVNSAVPPDPEVEATVEALKGDIEAKYGPIFSTEIGVAKSALLAKPREGSVYRDSEVGNLVSDAFRSAGQTDIAMTAAGLLFEGISEGPIVPVDLFRVVSAGYDRETGFGLPLMTGKLTGQELLEALEVTLSGATCGDSFFPVVSGLTFSYYPNRDPGSRLIQKSVRVNGEPLNHDRTYTITLNTVFATLLPHFGVDLAELNPLPGTFEFTALVDYAKTLEGSVEAPPLGRIRALMQRRAVFVPVF